MTRRDLAVMALTLAALLVGSGWAIASPDRQPALDLARQIHFDRSQELRVNGRLVLDHAVEVPAGVTVTVLTDGQVEFADGFTVRGGGVFTVRGVTPAEQSEAAEPTKSVAVDDDLLKARGIPDGLEFSLSRPAALNVSIVDVQGRSLLRLVDREFSAGTHGFDLRAVGAKAGVYFYRIGTGGVSRQGRVLVIP